MNAVLYIEDVIDAINHAHIQVEAFAWHSHSHFYLLHCQTFWDGEHRNMVQRLGGEGTALKLNNSRAHARLKYTL